MGVLNMDWLWKNWAKEDERYSPKRKVNNRGSHYYPHIIGSFFSQKNRRTVEYESLGERLFYYFLELDTAVIRYYVQPIEIPIYSNKEEWYHIPDVLVFRQGCLPLLYQVKSDQDEKLSDKVELCNRYCRAYALKYNWEYHLIYPKSMSEIHNRNIRMLKGFLKERKYYSQWYEPIVYRLHCLESCSVDFLASSFSDITDPLMLKPFIYHLIAKGTFIVNINEIIGSFTIITANTQMVSPTSLIKGDVSYVH
jgi:hypothetical protein